MVSRLQVICLTIALFGATGSGSYALPQASAAAARQSQASPPTRKAAPAPSSSSSSTASTASSKSTTVVIDPGHGGFDRGGIPGQRVPESMMNLDVALRLRDILRASGYPVVMTRSTDVFVTLGGRCAIANQYRNAIFVCVHFNSATRRGANGIETYF
jgi:N-acetylmuramoyl-L-alanine amidase